MKEEAPSEPDETSRPARISWGSAVGGAFALAATLQLLATFKIVPVLLELDPPAVEMWKLILDFTARTAWPLVAVLGLLLFSPEVRRFIDRLRNFKSPILSGELGPIPDISYKIGKLEGKKEAAESESDARTRPSALRYEGQLDVLYKGMLSSIGEAGNIILIALEYFPTFDMPELYRALRLSPPEVKKAFVRLYEKGLATKERAGARAQVTEVGRAYLRWLEESHLDEFNRALAKLVEDA